MAVWAQDGPSFSLFDEIQLGIFFRPRLIGDEWILFDDIVWWTFLCKGKREEPAFFHRCILKQANLSVCFLDISRKKETCFLSVFYGWTWGQTYVLCGGPVAVLLVLLMFDSFPEENVFQCHRDNGHLPLINVRSLRTFCCSVVVYVKRFGAAFFKWQNR